MSYDFNGNGRIDSGIEETVKGKIDDGDGDLELSDFAQEAAEKYGIHKAGDAAGEFVGNNLKGIGEIEDASDLIVGVVKGVVKFLGNIFI